MTNTAVMPDETTTKPAAMPESSVTDSNAPIQFKVADLSSPSGVAKRSASPSRRCPA